MRKSTERLFTIQTFSCNLPIIKTVMWQNPHVVVVLKDVLSLV